MGSRFGNYSAAGKVKKQNPRLLTGDSNQKPLTIKPYPMKIGINYLIISRSKSSVRFKSRI